MRRSENIILNGMKRAEKNRSVRFNNNINQIMSTDCSDINHYVNDRNYYSLEALAAEVNILIEALNFYDWKYDRVFVKDLAGSIVERDINIHSLIKPFIMPRSVRIEPTSLDSKDLLMRWDSFIIKAMLEEEKFVTVKQGNGKARKVLFYNRIAYFDNDLNVPVINEATLITVNTIINKVFYDDASHTANLVSLNSLRLNVSLASILDTISIEGEDRCKYSDFGFIPIPVIPEVALLFNTSWFTSSCEENGWKLEYYFNFK